MNEKLNFSKPNTERKLKELFVLSMDGNTEAYEGFLLLCSVIMKKYLRFLGGKYENKETTEDILQEVLISLHQKKHTFQLDKPLLPWLYAVARYRFIDFYRAKKRLPRMIELTDDIAAKSSEEFDFNFEEILDLLTPKQKELLLLVKVEGASYAEAASTLNMSVPSIKVGIHRVIKTIKAKVTK